MNELVVGALTVGVVMIGSTAIQVR